VAREQPHGKGAGVLVDRTLDMSQQCALAAQKANAPCGAPGPALPLGEGRGCLVLLCAVQPHLQHWAQVWGTTI